MDAYYAVYLFYLMNWHDYGRVIMLNCGESSGGNLNFRFKIDKN